MLEVDQADEFTERTWCCCSAPAAIGSPWLPLAVAVDAASAVLVDAQRHTRPRSHLLLPLSDEVPLPKEKRYTKMVSVSDITQKRVSYVLPVHTAFCLNRSQRSSKSNPLLICNGYTSNELLVVTVRIEWSCLPESLSRQLPTFCHNSPGTRPSSPSSACDQIRYYQMCPL